MNIPNLKNIPIINGRGPNAKAIEIVKGVLAGLEKGELVNVAVVAERRDGEPVMSFDFSGAAPGEAMKMRGALGFLVALLDKKLLGG